MRSCKVVLLALCAAVVSGVPVLAWTPVPVKDDPLVRMPGTQQGTASLEGSRRCLNCHSGYGQPVAEPGNNWKGSMMAQAARDFLFYACMVVAAQDSIHAVGRPNAVDICLRCHFPKGWAEGRSDPVNTSAMVKEDFDGVQCDTCHAMMDPHFVESHTGLRESTDWEGYWDEAESGQFSSAAAAAQTYQEDVAVSLQFTRFDGSPFFDPVTYMPFDAMWTVAGSGQFFLSSNGQKRASFADANPAHSFLYSRFHKSRNFCASCHDVSNPVLANLEHIEARPGDDVTLVTESRPAYSYYHVERTFSEFALSHFGRGEGAAGRGAFAPQVFATSRPDNKISTCQDCHMRDVSGRACTQTAGQQRPGSPEHPNSGVPMHDLTGGNMWVSAVLASAIQGSPNYDATNASILGQGPNVLTLDLTEGESFSAPAILAGVTRAQTNLEAAAAITDAIYDPATGSLRFRVENNTGHKLISGFPEGRRMFVNVRIWQGDTLLQEINPYDAAAGTLKGLDPDYSPSSPVLAEHELYDDALVYEAHPSSGITEEEQTFHFALADGRSKDNRIPPAGFDIASAPERLCQPVWHGQEAMDYFSAAEYAGGYDQVHLDAAAGADRVDIVLYYQTTSREYVEFLRDEINGSGRLTLPANAYVVQTDPFFSKLKAWGDAIWDLWQHNKDWAGAAPVQMTSAQAQIQSVAAGPIPEALQQPDGASVNASGVVSAVLGDVFYIQAQDRSNGIRIEMSDHGSAIADVCSVSGTMGMTADGERVIVASAVAVSGALTMEPLFVTQRQLGGADWMFNSGTGAGQAGVTGGTGLNNIGLLVAVAGRVTTSGPNFFTLDDGSGKMDASGGTGIRVRADGLPIPPHGAFVAVTGISSCYRTSGVVYPQVLARSQAEITLF